MLPRLFSSRNFRFDPAVFILVTRQQDLSRPPTFECPVCGRECDAVDGSRHHILPKSQGGRTVETICRPCHRQIHNLFGVKELARDFNTINTLKAAPEMQTWIRWVRRKPARRGPGV